QTAREILALPRLGAALARFPAPDGGALFAFDREGEPAAVCFPSAGRLLLWKDGRFEDAVWKPPGGVLALAATGPGALSFLVLREASVWRVDVSPAGEVSLPLPGVGPPALLRPDGTVVWGAGNTLFFRGSEGGVRQTGLPEAIHDLNQLTGDWIRARLADRQVAVRFPVGAPQVFELPEVSP
ncbi:MAG: hypothetical protein HY822_25365, partial [Acidobacteria bacterium]|nr:hypothetical protein [Acidobacteriota bacterium]